MKNHLPDRLEIVILPYGHRFRFKSYADQLAESWKSAQARKQKMEMDIIEIKMQQQRDADRFAMYRQNMLSQIAQSQSPSNIGGGPQRIPPLLINKEELYLIN